MPGGAQPARERASAASGRLNPIWYQYACATLVAAVVLGNLLRWSFLDYADPYGCGALMETGKWLDPGTWKNWQPEGCYQAALKGDALGTCLTTSTQNTPTTGTAGPRDRRAIFVGDSNVRLLYFATVRTIDGKTYGKNWEVDAPKHTDRQATVTTKSGERLTLDFWWDPFLNSTQTQDFITRPGVDPASLLVIGTGLWYLRQPSSGGMGAWTSIISSTFNTLRSTQGIPASPLIAPWDDMSVTHDNLMPGLFPDGTGADAANRTAARLAKQQTQTSVTRDFKIADAIIVLPIPNPVEDKLSEERAETIMHDDVDAMNADLLARLSHPSPPPILIPKIFNELLVDDETDDGLHWSDKIMNKQAELLLGWRCNDAVRKQGQEGTCCRRYNAVRPLQALTLLFLGLWAPVTAYFGALLPPGSGLQKVIPSGKAAAGLSTFGLAMSYLYLADRTTIFQKEQKDYDVVVFGGLTIAALIAGLATIKNRGKDLGFLNRDITDEWKGWMQSELYKLV